MGLGQNDVVLSFFELKRRRFGSAIFFLKFRPGPKGRRFGQNCCKTTSFWSSDHKTKTTPF